MQVGDKVLFSRKHRFGETVYTVFRHGEVAAIGNRGVKINVQTASGKELTYWAAPNELEPDLEDYPI